jgi:glutathione S-transferase
MDEHQPKIKLYWMDQSRAQSIVWLLEELNLSYEIELLHRKPSGFGPPELTKIHPLGKVPILSITPSEGADPIILAESGFIVQYLCDHFATGKVSSLVPPKWKPGLENRIGGETESHLRFQYLLHSTEGSFMPYLILAILTSRLRGSDIPFFIRPISSAIASKVNATFVFPNAKRNLEFLDQLLETSPEGGKYLCGKGLTAADIIMSFSLLLSKNRFKSLGKWEGGSPESAFPRVYEYAKRLEESEGYKRSVKKIEELEARGKK